VAVGHGVGVGGGVGAGWEVAGTGTLGAVDGPGPPRPVAAGTLPFGRELRVRSAEGSVGEADRIGVGVGVGSASLPIAPGWGSGCVAD
jgi:hypothetical protein